MTYRRAIGCDRASAVVGEPSSAYGAVDFLLGGSFSPGLRVEVQSEPELDDRPEGLDELSMAPGYGRHMERRNPMMRAISLWRPWPWAIVHAPRDPKRVENRSYRPRCLLGGDVALHAGQRWASEAAGHLAAFYPSTFPDDRGAHPLGVVAVARVVGWLGFEQQEKTEVVGQVELADHIWSPWLVGPIAWVLDDVRALATPVACTGRQGIWTLPVDVETAVQAQLARDASGGMESGRSCSKPAPPTGQIGSFNA